MDHLGSLNKKKVDIDEIQKRIEKDEINLSSKESIVEINQKDLIKSNSDSIKAVALIRSYRQRGHLIAKLDPLGMLRVRIFG